MVYRDLNLKNKTDTILFRILSESSRVREFMKTENKKVNYQRNL